MTNVHIGSVCEYFIPRTVGGCGRKGVTGGGLRDFMTLPKYQFALCSAFVMADVMSVSSSGCTLSFLPCH